MSVTVLHCPNCNASVKPGASKCEYCNTYFAVDPFKEYDKKKKEAIKKAKREQRKWQRHRKTLKKHGLLLF